MSCGQASQTTFDASTTNITITGLAAATSYSCCVTALYSDVTENAERCGDGTTLEGSKTLLLTELLHILTFLRMLMIESKC